MINWIKSIFDIILEKKDNRTRKREIRKVKLILNPVSGEGKTKKALRGIRSALHRREPNLRLKTFLSGEEGEAYLAAKEAVIEGYEMVIVAGGDGTIKEVVSGLANSNVVLGIIPLGTANTFAEEARIPTNIDSACKLLATGKVHRVDLGRIKDHYFLWIAGIGIDAYVAKATRTSQVLKETMGTLSYFLIALSFIGKVKAHKMKIIIDGKEIHTKAANVIIGNLASFDGDLKINGFAASCDGYLDVCVYRRITFLAIIRGIFWFILGRKTYYRDVKYFDVEYYKGKNIKIDSYPPALVHVSGEIIGETPIECEVVPSALSVIIPA